MIPGSRVPTKRSPSDSDGNDGHSVSGSRSLMNRSPEDDALLARSDAPVIGSPSKRSKTIANIMEDDNDGTIETNCV